MCLRDDPMLARKAETLAIPRASEFPLKELCVPKASAACALLSDACAPGLPMRPSFPDLVAVLGTTKVSDLCLGLAKTDTPSVLSATIALAFSCAFLDVCRVLDFAWSFSAWV